MIYLFDVDGTLTEPLETIRPEMVWELRRLTRKNKLYLAAGSDAAKVYRQITPEHLHDTSLFTGWFCCSGAEFYIGDTKQYSLPVPSREKHPDVFTLMEWFLNDSKYPERTGNHLELRPGMVNLSTVGRNATPAQREKYEAWDKIHGERKLIAAVLEENFKTKGITCAIGGMISIDIFFEGFTGKCSAVKHLEGPNTHFVYYGDKTLPGGNDHSAVRYIEDKNIGYGIQVENSKKALLKIRSMMRYRG